MRNGMILTLVAVAALAGCAVEHEGQRMVGSQGLGEPASELHSARIAGYSWGRPAPEKPTLGETPSEAFPEGHEPIEEPGAVSD